MEFRALFISTVRTQQSVEDPQDLVNNRNMEFLSDPKLLVTAVTRAKSLVAVVGDPVSLCTLGECQKVWRDFITRCDTLETLHGTTVAELPVAQPKQLNPEAPMFVPQTDSKVQNSTSSEEVVENNENEEKEDVDEQANQSSISSSDDVDDTFDDKEQKIEDPPPQLDQIIQALVEHQAKKESRHRAKTSEDEEEFSDEDEKARKVSAMGLSATDFEIVRINGRDVTRLIIPSHRNPSERAIQAQKTQYRDVFQQDNLAPEVLYRMVQEEPDKYKICQIRFGQYRIRAAYLEFPDRTLPDVKINNHVRQAFDRDTVVVDTTKIKPTGSSKSNCIVGK